MNPQAHDDFRAGRRARATLGAYSLSNLLRGAARLDPHGPAVSGPLRRNSAITQARFTYRELDREADCAARRLMARGLAPGERVLVIGGADPACLIALLGAARAGLAVVMSHAGRGARDLAVIAAMSEAAALIGAGDFPGLDFTGRLFEAAAHAAGVRLVALYGAAPTDGAIALDAPEAEGEAPEAELPADCGAFISVDSARGSFALVPHQTAALAAAALDLTARIEADGAAPVLSLLAPLSFAGLSAGPIAAIVSGSPLRLCGLFGAQSFLAAADTAPAPHLIAPDALGPALAEAGLLEPKQLASLTLLTRHQSGPALRGAREPAPLADCTVPLFDLIALAEAAVLTRRRSGDPLAPETIAHYIDVDGEIVLACETRAASGGGLDVRGLAVEDGDGWRSM